jgi:hypothetical protein
MPYTITTQPANMTIVGSESKVGDPVRVYATAQESATYEVQLGAATSAYVITSQESK